MISLPGDASGRLSVYKFYRIHRCMCMVDRQSVCRDVASNHAVDRRIMDRGHIDITAGETPDTDCTND